MMASCHRIPALDLSIIPDYPAAKQHQRSSHIVSHSAAADHSSHRRSKVASCTGTHSFWYKLKDKPVKHCFILKPFSPLLQAVSDITGKEDLIAALRRSLLLRVAAQLGCNKVALGTSATRMAVRTVAMSAKGSGYALPGAIHFTDSRCRQ